MDKRLKVLLIEDDPFLQSMYSLKFDTEGWDVLSASDGVTGLKMALESQPDIVLLDIMMPEMDGFQVLETLRADERGRNMPVIMLTNLNQNDDLQRARSLNALDYLVKAHYMPSEVVARIRKALNMT